MSGNEVEKSYGPYNIVFIQVDVKYLTFFRDSAVFFPVTTPSDNRLKFRSAGKSCNPASFFINTRPIPT